MIASRQPRLLIGLPLRDAVYRSRLRKGQAIPVRASRAGLLTVKTKTRGRGYRQVARRRVRSGLTLLRLPRAAARGGLRYELTAGRKIAIALR